MQRINAVSYEQSTGKAKELLNQVQAKFGITPNLMKTMAQSPAVLEAYLNFSGALAGAALDAKLRKQISILTKELNNLLSLSNLRQFRGRAPGNSPRENVRHQRQSLSLKSRPFFSRFPCRYQT